MSKYIATSKQPRRHRPLLSRLARFLTPLILGRARGRHSLFAVIHHRGRRSGRAYASPVSAWPTADGFVVPLTFGEGSDWVQNIRAAGGCELEWKGMTYALTDPEVIDRAAASSAFSPFERAMIPLMGVEQFVHLRHAQANGNRPM